MSANDVAVFVELLQPRPLRIFFAFATPALPFAGNCSTATTPRHNRTPIEGPTPAQLQRPPDRSREVRTDQKNPSILRCEWAHGEASFEFAFAPRGEVHAGHFPGGMAHRILSMLEAKRPRNFNCSCINLSHFGAIIQLRLTCFMLWSCWSVNLRSSGISTILIGIRA
ncbi:hypothetical protein niasHS_016130 [Heterodera schachtii]|uniref:Uncharacterized protein n=1 Tax=Heterodera schachtii TaxID=97005 RepID=A0ABD2HV69_HETSC